MARDKKLTAKQEAFVLAYLETADEDEAYMMAYDAKGMSHASVHKEARRLLEHPQIAPRLERQALQIEAKGLLSLEDHMSKLADLRDKAEENGQMGPAIKAEELRGKLSRHYVIQVETGEPGEFKQMTTPQLREHVLSEAAALRASPTKH